MSDSHATIGEEGALPCTQSLEIARGMSPGVSHCNPNSSSEEEELPVLLSFSKKALALDHPN